MAQSPVKTGAKKTSKPAAKAASPKAATPKAEAKDKFAKAIEEAKAGAAAISAGMREKAEGYRTQASAKSADWLDEAKQYGDQAKTKASELAVEGKARATDALSGLGKLVADNAGTIDERFGEKYGDYARTASRKIEETASKLGAKDLAELGDDAKEFVRKSPGLAIGLAAVAGFMVARLFSSGSKE